MKLNTIFTLCIDCLIILIEFNLVSIQSNLIQYNTIQYNPINRTINIIKINQSDIKCESIY